MEQQPLPCSELGVQPDLRFVRSTGRIVWEHLSKWRNVTLERVPNVSWELYFCEQGRRTR